MAKQHSRPIRWFFKKTDIMRGPTDHHLDQEIEKMSFFMKEFYPMFKRILKDKIWRFFRYWGWLRLLLRISLIFLIVALTYYITINYVRPIVSPGSTRVVTKEIYVRNLRSWNQFVNHVGERESSNNWGETKGQYLGRFMFGESAFYACKQAGLDIDKLGRDNFLNNEELQIVYFKELLKLNRKDLKGIILTYDMREVSFVNGTVTESGILMAAHLRGSSSVKEFFRTKGVVNKTDENEVSVKDYIEKFSGYKLDI